MASHGSSISISSQLEVRLFRQWRDYCAELAIATTTQTQGRLVYWAAGVRLVAICLFRTYSSSLGRDDRIERQREEFVSDADLPIGDDADDGRGFGAGILHDLDDLTDRTGPAEEAARALS